MSKEVKTKNLMEGLLEEMNRVRELITRYKELPMGAGMIGAILMENNIKIAEKAIGSSNVIDMLKIYEQLKGHE